MEPKWETPLSEHQPLEHLSIRMFGKKYELQPAADLEYHPSTLGEDLQKQPSLYAFYATVHSMAQAKVTALSQQLEHSRSIIDAEYRSDECLPNGAKITEDGLRRAVRIHPDCVKAQKMFEDATFEAMCLGNIVRAFEHRRECLVELNKRAGNSTFNDRDINVTVSAKITPLDLSGMKNVGAHPSKKARQ